MNKEKIDKDFFINVKNRNFIDFFYFATFNLGMNPNL